MTAASRLKALHEAWGGDALRETQAVRELFGALPALIELVEAAERTVNTDENGMGMVDDNGCTAEAVRKDLAPSLKALSETLSRSPVEGENEHG